MSRQKGERWAAFPAALRGYRSDQVDRYLDMAEAAIAAGRSPAEPEQFDLALRGYDRQLVDRFIDGLLREG